MGRLISDWYKEGEVLAPWARSGPERDPYWDEVVSILRSISGYQEYKTFLEAFASMQCGYETLRSQNRSL